MGLVPSQSYKKDGLYLCSDIRNEEQTSIGRLFQLSCRYVTGPHLYIGNTSGKYTTH